MRVAFGFWCAALLAVCVRTPLMGMDADGKTVLLAALDGRTKLVSGKCRIRGEITYRRKPEDLQLDITFDFSRRMSLFQTKTKMGSTYVNDGKFQYVIPYRRTSVRRIPLTEFPHITDPPFDIRTLGFYPYASKATFSSWRVLDYNRLREYLAPADVVEFHRDGALYRLAIRVPKLTEQDQVVPLLRLWVNSAQDFAITRFQQVDHRDGKTVIYTSDMDYTKQNGIWVIDTFRQEVFNPNNRFIANWRLKWYDINKEIPRSSFDVRTLIPRGKSAVLYTIEKPSNRDIVLGKIESAGNPKPQVPRAHGTMSLARVLLVAGLGMVIAACLVAAYRRRVRQR